jgi:hypothetical protein
MIAVERRGRLGNQLFQFAFGIAASHRLGTQFVMADDQLRELFTLGPFGRPAERIARSLRYRAERAVRAYAVAKVDNTDYEAPSEVLDALRDRALYAGFFQSETFFAECRETVREAFTPRPRHVRVFRERYGSLLQGDYLCCHVRRTDYLKWGDGMALPASYYTDALRSLDGFEGKPVVFVGDDLDEVEAVFGDRPNVRFERNAEIVDLLLMTHAAAVVSSNSSFSWWGSWLGPEDRTVVAPRHWLGFRDGREFPPDVVPQRWRSLTVSE